MLMELSDLYYTVLIQMLLRRIYIQGMARAFLIDNLSREGLFWGPGRYNGDVVTIIDRTNRRVDTVRPSKPRGVCSKIQVSVHNTETDYFAIDIILPPNLRVSEWDCIQM
jgi:hypothetical protein